jgi:hypothetical protein
MKNPGAMAGVLNPGGGRISVHHRHREHHHDGRTQGAHDGQWEKLFTVLHCYPLVSSSPTKTFGGILVRIPTEKKLLNLPGRYPGKLLPDAVVDQHRLRKKWSQCLAPQVAAQRPQSRPGTPFDRHAVRCTHNGRACTFSENFAGTFFGRQGNDIKDLRRRRGTAWLNPARSP